MFTDSLSRSEKFIRYFWLVLEIMNSTLFSLIYFMDSLNKKEVVYPFNLIAVVFLLTISLSLLYVSYYCAYKTVGTKWLTFTVVLRILSLGLIPVMSIKFGPLELSEVLLSVFYCLFLVCFDIKMILINKKIFKNLLSKSVVFDNALKDFNKPRSCKEMKEIKTYWLLSNRFVKEAYKCRKSSFKSEDGVTCT